MAETLGAERTEDEVAAALRSMANAKAVGPNDLPAELLKLGLHENHTILRVLDRIIKLVWHGGQVPQQWKDATIKVLHKKKDRTVWQLSWHLTRGACGQGPPRGRRYETRRLLRGKRAAARGTVWFPPTSFDHGHDVCGTPVAGTGAERRGATLSVLHRPREGARLSRSQTAVARWSSGYNIRPLSRNL